MLQKGKHVQRHELTTLLGSRTGRKFGESENKIKSNYKMSHILCVSSEEIKSHNSSNCSQEVGLQVF